MNTRIKCITFFDITATGTKGAFRSSLLPMKDRAGVAINDQSSWNYSRNQQRNWETVNQIMSLRCLPENISLPKDCQYQNMAAWTFDFEVQNIAAISDQRELDLLLKDCEGVPMITGLGEYHAVGAVLKTDLDANIWFEITNDK